MQTPVPVYKIALQVDLFYIYCSIIKIIKCINIINILLYQVSQFYDPIGKVCVKLCAEYLNKDTNECMS